MQLSKKLSVYVAGLGYYFNIKHGLRKDAIQVILDKLREIEQWFLTQRQFSFYASSLLLVYEGDTQQNDLFPSCNRCQSVECKCSTSMKSLSTDFSDNASSEATDSTDLASTDTDLTSTDTAMSSQTDGSSLTASSSNVSVNTASTSGTSPLNSHHPVIADVKMIDFTHVFHVTEQDDNYLYGLQNLIANMQQLLAMDL